MTRLKYEVYEDNGGGITMFVFDADGNPIWGHAGYEYYSERLLRDIEALKKDDDVSGWDGNGSWSGYSFDTWAELGTTLDEYYKSTSSDRCIQLVADLDGIYPDKMGQAAAEAFGIEI